MAIYCILIATCPSQHAFAEVSGVAQSKQEYTLGSGIVKRVRRLPWAVCRPSSSPRLGGPDADLPGRDTVRDDQCDHGGGLMGMIVDAFEGRIEGVNRSAYRAEQLSVMLESGEMWVITQPNGTETFHAGDVVRLLSDHGVPRAVHEFPIAF
ncbi:hypothetical protein [Burkholderia sp. BE17]|uniref:hypothetical protein n=1 Tax=Burkholderia sp. BE17 TaxID=2656644 RepID=UPI00128CFA6A|nr:hypothetical protein [Burkholderia sp. BE17]MPV68637.1 hypothetical protein [Burkholderia sp. BE17]